jgi:hypothetical protein
MAFNRYSRDPRINLGSQLGTSEALYNLRSAIKRGLVPITRTFTSTVDDRLDTLAGSLYGDARYWWVIAAASDIGWGLQIPPGTIIRVVDLVDVEEVL